MQRFSPSTLSPSRSGSSTSSVNWVQSLVPLGRIFALLLLLIVMGKSMQSTTGLRFIIASSLLLMLATLLWKYPTVGTITTFAFLVVLGGVRRWLIPDFGWLSYDPLILIGAIIALLSFFPLLMSRTVPQDTPVSKYIKYLLIIMALQFFNPLQGGFFVGFGGILFYTAPLLWFYVGRNFGNLKILSFLISSVVILYTATGVYGMKQVIFGLSSSEQEWIKVGGYEALNVSADAIRVFSTFASQQEYAITLACAISICATFIIQRKTLYVLPLVILIPALFLTAARGPIVAALLAVSVQWAINGRRRATVLPRLGFALLIGMIGLSWSLSSIKTESLSAGQRDIIRHQQEGILDPGKSTAPGHITMVFDGIFRGFQHPLGLGLGSTTIAAGKLGGEIALGSESDYGNLFISLGAIGGIIYVVVIFWTFKQCSTLWRESRNISYLALMGLLVVCFGQWLSGGLYSLCFLIWFSIGVMDREFARKLAAEAPPVETDSRRGSRSKKQLQVRKPTMRRRTLQLNALGYNPSHLL